MKIVVYNVTPKGGIPILDSFIYSLQEAGEEVIIIDKFEMIDCDALVMWSVLWRIDQKSLWEAYRAKNIPVIVLEVGGLVRNTYWKIGINGINRMGEYANHDCPSDRWDKLGIEMKPWRDDGDHILLCAQNERSGAWNTGLSMAEYTEQTITEIRKYTDRKIVVRMHPRARFQFDTIEKNIEVKSPEPFGNDDDFDLLVAMENAWAVISHNSNPAIEAIINGIPAFVDETSLSYEVGAGALKDIESPRTPDRTQWANNMAYAEWNDAEIRAGLPWERIKGFITP